MATHVQQPISQFPTQYVVCVQDTGHNRVDHKREYSPKHLGAVKWLTITQLVLGIVILFLHIATTSFDSVVMDRIELIQTRYGTNLYFRHLSADAKATGVWVGLLIILTAGVGIGGYRKQKRCLIVTHLVLNILLMLCYIPLVSTLSATISGVTRCRSEGVSYLSFRHTFTARDVAFFGEDLNGLVGHLYCKNGLFRAWIALDAIILSCALVEFFITFSVLVYNSVAACVCCRQCGYGTCGYETSPHGDHQVTYCRQPVIAGASGTTGVPGVLASDPIAGSVMYKVPADKPMGVYDPSVSLPPYTFSPPSHTSVQQVGDHMSPVTANQNPYSDGLPPAYSEVNEAHQPS